MQDGQWTRLGVSVPAWLAQEVAAYAGAHGLRPGEALRYLIEAGLAAEAHAMLTSRAPEDAPAAPLAAALIQAANDEGRTDAEGLRAR